MVQIPAIILHHLETLEPNAKFSGRLPRIESSSGQSYFAKVGSTRETEQYIGEAESLKAMDAAAPGLVPRVFASGVSESDSRPFMLSEYLTMGSLDNDSGAELGKRLATELHRYKSENGFGFAVPTYCGATRMRNGWYSRWEECFDAMIGDLLDTLKSRGNFPELCKKGDKIRERVIPALLGSLDIDPVLCHGDLWSGNTGTKSETGEPVIFDPSSFYGHNEADLAIARIFGGIPRSVFEEYHKHLPKTEPADQYEQRGDLYELFHYLNHTVLFGSGYSGSALAKMDSLLGSTH